MSGFGQMIGGMANSWIGSNAADNAASAQMNAGGIGLEQGQKIYDTNSANYQPYIKGGQQAEGQLQSLAGPTGSLGRQFTQADFQKDPAYNFDVQQGQQGIVNGAVQGGALSGGTLKALTGYGQQMASNEYQSAYNRFVANQNQNFGQLSSMAGQGLNATQGLGQLGNAWGNAQMQQQNTLGNAQAAGIIGAANAQEGGITNLTQGASSLGQGQLGSLFGGS